MAISGIQLTSWINDGVIAPDPATGNWKLMPLIRTENLDISPMEIEANIRNGGGSEFRLTGLRANRVSLTYLFDKNDIGYVLMKNAALQDLKYQFAFMFPDFSSGSEGLVSPMNILEFSYLRDYDSVCEVSVTLAPYYVASALPQWYVVP